MKRALLFLMLAAVFVLVYSLLPSPDLEEPPSVVGNDNSEGPEPVTAMDIYAHIISPIF